MTAYYESSVPISRLSAKTEIVSSDVLLVSEYNPESDSLYYTDQVAAGRYGQLISAQLSVQEMKDETSDTSAKIAIVSSDCRSIRVDFDQLSGAFLSNDQLTRGIPALSAEKNFLSSASMSTLRHERIIDLGAGDMGKFYLSAFAVNVCRPSGVNMLRFVLPPELPGLSRHFTIKVSSDADFVPAFYGNAELFAETPFDGVCQAGREIYYDFKEVRRNGFYVRFGTPPASYDADSDEVTIIYHTVDDLPQPDIGPDPDPDVVLPPDGEA